MEALKGNGVVVRHAVEDDRAAIAGVIAHAYRREFSILTRDIDKIAGALDHAVAIERFFVAEQHGDVVGAIACTDCTGRADLSFVATLGIGDRLAAKAARDAAVAASNRCAGLSRTWSAPLPANGIRSHPHVADLHLYTGVAQHWQGSRYVTRPVLGDGRGAPSARTRPPLRRGTARAATTAAGRVPRRRSPPTPAPAALWRAHRPHRSVIRRGR